jgi:hypothetical protein
MLSTLSNPGTDRQIHTIFHQFPFKNTQIHIQGLQFFPLTILLTHPLKHTHTHTHNYTHKLSLSYSYTHSISIKLSLIIITVIQHCFLPIVQMKTTLLDNSQFAKYLKKSFSKEKFRITLYC